jgi:hypothetical protein
VLPVELPAVALPPLLPPEEVFPAVSLLEEPPLEAELPAVAGVLLVSFVSLPQLGSVISAATRLNAIIGPGSVLFFMTRSLPRRCH